MTTSKLAEIADTNNLCWFSSFLLPAIMLSKEVKCYVISVMENILSEKYQNQEKWTIFHSFLHSLNTSHFIKTYHFAKNISRNRFNIVYGYPQHHISISIYSPNPTLGWFWCLNSRSGFYKTGLGNFLVFFLTSHICSN